MKPTYVANAVTTSPNADPHRRIFHRLKPDEQEIACTNMASDLTTKKRRMTVPTVLLCRRCFPR